MTNLEIIKENLSAFIDWDKSKLHFADSVVHSSPEGHLEGLDALLDACWEKMPALQLEDYQAVDMGNIVVIRYTIMNEHGSFPITEWYTLTQKKIVRVDVYYGWK